MPIRLDDLLPAKSAEAIAAPANKVQNQEFRQFRAKQRTRLVAQEYVRNGMDLYAAYSTVQGCKLIRNISAAKLLGKNLDAFMDEVSNIVGKSDIERDKALEFLWALLHISILDFFDDNGEVLSIKSLKKLPRIMQMMLSEIDVKQVDTPVTMADGKTPVLDDNGSPYLKRTQHVKIKIPEKISALNQLAQIMRWVGPLVKVDVNLNVGRTMADADARTESLGRVYEGTATRLD